MALTDIQKQQLDATYNREGGQTATDLANIEYAKTQGYVPPTTAVTTPITPVTPVDATVDTSRYSRLPSGVTQDAYFKISYKNVDKNLFTGIKNFTSSTPIILFTGFANSYGTVGDLINVSVSGLKNTFSGLTAGNLYCAGTSGSIKICQTNASTTSIGLSLSDTSLLIKQGR